MWKWPPEVSNRHPYALATSDQLNTEAPTPPIETSAQNTDKMTDKWIDKTIDKWIDKTTDKWIDRMTDQVIKGLAHL